MTETGSADHLIAHRDRVLAEMTEADLELSRVRMRVEALESDIRIGRAESPDYAELKGHALPQAEAAVIGLYRELARLEDRIRLGKLRQSAEPDPAG